MASGIDQGFQGTQILKDRCMAPLLVLTHRIQDLEIMYFGFKDFKLQLEKCNELLLTRRMINSFPDLVRFSS